MADTSIILGNYELLEVIGDGAEGRVYKARCVAEGVAGISAGELVALKRLKSTRQDKESQQFRREVHILRKLNHPNIVRYRDSFIWREHELEEDIHCLVMELIDGEPLKARLQRQGGAMGWDEAEPVLFQILQALEYAARHGVVHRDLKPSNILITSQGQPKLIDFGIARQEDGEGTATNTAAAGARGTFDYMAPDFANMLQKGFRGDERSDIFSYGVLTYYALTGRLPYPPFGENPMGEYYHRWLGTERPKADFRHPIFRILRHARPCIAKCLEADRTLRFGSFAELAGEFSKVGYRRMKLGADTYEFFEWLGKGGYGEVFRARRLGDQREVAIKRLFSASQGPRIKREAKLLQAAPHPNLVEYIDFAEVSARLEEVEYYLILEYLEGMPGASLRDRIRNSEAGMEAAETLQIFADYLDCLEHLHRHGIIHRDIKPGNLYVSGDHPPKAKIFDLGIAYDEEGTRTHGQVPGTLDFMAPELAKPSSGRGSAQSDLYSIGVTLYQALTKKLPFPPLPVNETEGWVGFFARAEKPVACAFDHAVFRKHPELVPLLQRALAPDPRERPESAWALRAEILAIVDGWERKKSYDLSMAAGQAAFDRQDYDEAEQQVLRALTQMPRDRAAESLRSKIQQGRTQQQYELAVARARAALGSGDYDEAEQQVLRALTQIPRDRAAESLRSKIQQGRAQQQYELFVARARAALGSGDYAEAERASALALKLVPGDPAALQLLSQSKLARTAEAEMDEPPTVGGERPTAVTIEPRQEAVEETRQTEVKAREPSAVVAPRVQEDSQPDEPPGQVASEMMPQAGGFPAQLPAPRRSPISARLVWMVTASVALVSVAVALACVFLGPSARFQRHLDAAQRAYFLMQYPKALAEAGAALVIRPQDEAARKWKGMTEDRLAEQDTKYRDALAAGQVALAKNNYDDAARQAGTCLQIRPQDPEATKLLREADAARLTQQKRDQAYAEALASGQKAHDGKDYATAIQQAELALANRPNDATATKLKNEAAAGLATQDKRDQAYGVALASGQKAYEGKDYAAAIQQAELALADRPNDAKATKLKSEAAAELAAQDKRDQNYTAALASGQKAYAGKDYATAIQQAGLALENRPNDPKAAKLKSDAAAELAAQDKRDQNYTAALASGQKAYEAKDYATAIQQAELALANRPNDATATKLKNEASAELATQDKRDQAYGVALASGQKAYAGKDYTTAIQQAGLALANRPNDAKAAKLKSDAQAALAELDRKFEAAMQAGNLALTGTKYEEAIKQANEALVNHPHDPQAEKLKSDAQAALAALAERDRKYQAAMLAGNLALTGTKYEEAIKQANEALVNHPHDPQAEKLKTDAQAALAERVERDRKYQAAMASGQKAYDGKDYATAIQQAGVGLANRPNDPEATKLKNDSVTAQKQYAAAVKEGQIALASTNCDQAVQKAEEAMRIWPLGTEAPDLKAKAQDVREKSYRAAFDAAQKAYQSHDYATAIRSSKVALTFQPTAEAAVELKKDAAKEWMKAKNDELGGLMGKFNISDFDFVWIPDLRNGNGGYVERSALSQAQYGQLGLKSVKSPIAGTMANLSAPQNLSYDEARALVDALNKRVQTLSPHLGQFQLPDREDVLVYSGINWTRGNPRFQEVNDHGCFAGLGSIDKDRPPKGVREGSPNEYGLFNVFGNAWQWCSDGHLAGFSCDTTTTTLNSYNSLFCDPTLLQGKYTGVRLLFVPAP